MRVIGWGRSPRSAPAMGLALAVLTVATILGSCATAPEQARGAAASTTVSSTVPGDELTELDLAFMTAYREIVTGAGAMVWPGWGDNVAPILQRGDVNEYLVGHPDPPAGFLPTGLEVGRAAIWSGPAGTITPGAYAAPWNIGGTWGAMIPLRPVLEQAVESALGVDAVAWDDAAYMRAVLHEGFHSFQFEINEEFPTFADEPTDDGVVIDALLQVADLEAQYAQEARILHAAIGAADLEAARDFVRQFLELRRTRREALPAMVASHEKVMEWVEGVARYADVKLLTLAYRSGAAMDDIHIPDEAVVLGSYLDDLSADPPRADGLPGWWQTLGSAQGFVLDRLSLGWQDQLLLETRSLEDLLEEAVSVPPSLAQFPIARLRVGSADFLAAVARTPEEWATGLGDAESIGPIEGMLFWFPEDVTGSGFTMEGAPSSLDITFFAADGSQLATLSMPPCVADPCPTYGPETAFRYAIEIPSTSSLSISDEASLLLPRLPQGQSSQYDLDQGISQ